MLSFLRENLHLKLLLKMWWNQCHFWQKVMRRNKYILNSTSAIQFFLTTLSGLLHFSRANCCGFVSSSFKPLSTLQNFHISLALWCCVSQVTSSCASQSLLIPARCPGGRQVQAPAQPSHQFTHPKNPFSSASLHAHMLLRVCRDKSALWAGSGLQNPLWPSEIHGIS